MSLALLKFSQNRFLCMWVCVLCANDNLKKKKKEHEQKPLALPPTYKITREPFNKTRLKALRPMNMQYCKDGRNKVGHT